MPPTGDDPCVATDSVSASPPASRRLGTHLLSTWPTLVELVGQAGNYDYVEFTAEYAPFDMHDLDNLGRALELMNVGGMIKVEQTPVTHQAMRAIGSGFQSVLFADVRTVEDARACVAAVRAETPGTGGRLGCRHAARRRHRARCRLARLSSRRSTMS